MTTKASVFAGSIALKFGGVLAVVTGLLFATTWISFTQFGQFSVALIGFQKEVVPDLIESSAIIEDTGELTAELSDLLIANSRDELEKHLGDTQAVLADLLGDNNPSADTAVGKINDQIRAVADEFSQVAEARHEELARHDAMLAKVQRLGDAVTAATDRLIHIANTSYLTARGTDPQRPAADLRAPLTRMARATELERLLGDLESALLTGATAERMGQVQDAQATADGLVHKVQTLATHFSDDAKIPPAIDEIVAFAGVKDGILAGRFETITGRIAANDAARLAAERIRDVTASARVLEQAAIGQIEMASGSLAVSAANGRVTMVTVTTLAVLCMAAAVAITLLLILRPLQRIIRVTERLARGDFAPVTGFDRHGGEIGRMARALTVFRDGMIERERLTADEARHAAAARQRAEQEERDLREREAAERRRRDLQQAEEHRREQEDMRQREARAAEQDRIVAALATAMKQLAAGDLTVHLADPFPAAYEPLRKDFNSAILALSDLIGTIIEGATRIDENAAEIATSADELARRTETSAATLEETAAALNEMTASVGSTATVAAQANKVAAQMNGRAQSSADVVRDAIAAMSEIESSSRRIASIMDVIDHIARQTNLLALNAAVEAARAGDAGRGFAVVASEVRALAQRSSEAAGEINGLILESNDQVARGAKLVHDTGDALRGIVVGMGEIAQMVEGITQSAQEQAGGIHELNAATGQLDTTMQQNAAMTEETTAATRVLIDESRKLRDMVRRFRLGTADNVIRLEPQVA